MNGLIIVLIAIFILLLLFFFVCPAYRGWQGIPWVPTRRKDIKRFLKLSRIKPGQKMYDLGCGDGRLVCAAAKVGAEAYGFELSLLPFVLANIQRLFQKNRNKIKIMYRDFWHTDLSNADIIYLYLLPKMYPKLKKKFEKELKKNTVVITYVWPIEGWTPLHIDAKNHSPNFYLYKIIK